MGNILSGSVQNLSHFFLRAGLVLGMVTLSPLQDLLSTKPGEIQQAFLRQARQLQGKIRGDLKVFGIKLGKVGSGGFATRVKARLATRPELWALLEPLLRIRAELVEGGGRRRPRPSRPGRSPSCPWPPGAGPGRRTRTARDA